MVQDSSRILALDVGRRRVGIASASPVARIAASLPTLDMTDNFIDQLKEVIFAESIGTIVVGLPIGMNRQETEQTEFVYNFIRELTAACPELNITTYEETLTSKQAEAELNASGRSFTKADIDARAAQLILQGYLDSEVHHG